MKNLLNTIVFKAVALFAMVLLVATAVTSNFNSQDQFNDIGGKNKENFTPRSLVSPIGIGGRSTTSSDAYSYVDIGGRNGNGTSGEENEAVAIGESTNTIGAIYSNSGNGDSNLNVGLEWATSTALDPGGRGNELGSGGIFELPIATYSMQ